LFLQCEVPGLQVPTLEVLGITTVRIGAGKVDDPVTNVRSLDYGDAIGDLSGRLEGVGDIDDQRRENGILSTQEFGADEGVVGNSIAGTNHEAIGGAVCDADARANTPFADRD